MRTRRCTPALRLEEAVRVHALDLEHRALDAGFFALAQVEDLDRVALSLGPARVHAHEHRGPVLRLGAAGAGADLELRVAEVVRTRQQRAKAERFDLARRAPSTSRSTSAASSASGSDGEHLLELARALHAAARSRRTARPSPSVL